MLSSPPTQNNFPPLALRQLVEPELPSLPLRTISWRLSPCRTISRCSPCGIPSSPKSLGPRPEQSHAAPSPPHTHNNFPALALRQLFEPKLPHAPAQRNFLPPLMPPSQNSIPALAPRQLFEPKIALVPLHAISCRAPSSPPPRRAISRRSPCGNYSSPNSPCARSKQSPATSPTPLRPAQNSLPVRAPRQLFEP